MIAVNDVIDSLKNVKGIDNKKGIIKALWELDTMIGLGGLKNEILMTVSSNLHKMITGESSSIMPHTMLYGPPGVGKSQLGSILGRIWSNMGFLDSSNRKCDEEDENEERKRNGPDMFALSIIISQDLTIRKMAKLTNKVKKDYTRSPIAKRERINHNLDLIQEILSGDSVKATTRGDMGYEEEEEEDGDDEEEDGDDEDSEDSEDSEEDDEEETRVIDETVFCSSTDFVAGYVGQTQLKTTAFLNKHAGKVIFIDEAYTLATDSFGEAALTVINRYMTEKPHEYVFIFAGYKDKMDAIMKVQPGLRRRFPNTFEIKEYSASELGAIFDAQLTKMKVDNVDSTMAREFIARNKSDLPCFGGDTLRLANRVSQICCSRKFLKLKHKVTKKILSEALDSFRTPRSTSINHMYG